MHARSQRGRGARDKSASAVEARPRRDSTALGGSAAQTMVSTRRRGRSRQFTASNGDKRATSDRMGWCLRTVSSPE